MSAEERGCTTASRWGSNGLGGGISCAMAPSIQACAAVHRRLHVMHTRLGGQQWHEADLHVRL